MCTVNYRDESVYLVKSTEYFMKHPWLGSVATAFPLFNLQVSNVTYKLNYPPMNTVLVSNVVSNDSELPASWGMTLMREVVLSPETNLMFLDNQTEAGFNAPDEMTCFE